MAKTLAEALNEAQVEDTDVDAGASSDAAAGGGGGGAAAGGEADAADPDAGGTADDAADEGAGDEAGSGEDDEPAGEGEAPDGEGSEDEGAGTGAGADDEETPLEGITPEQLAEIKKNPQTAALYKTILRAYTKGTMRNAEVRRLAEAWLSDPEGVLKAVATSRGYKVEKLTETPPADPAKAQQDALNTAVARVEALFGKKAGPQARAIFGDFIKAIVNESVTPIQQTLGQVVAEGQQARMASEEEAFKQRHKAVLTPEIETEVVQLGESGLIVPGKGMPPAKYLDTLLEVVMSRRARKSAAAALAKRIKERKSEQEPTRAVSSRGPISKVSKVKAGMRLDEAFDIADQELDEEGRER